MKLITKKESDRIFAEYSGLGKRFDDLTELMDYKEFNEAVNAMLLDEKIVKAVLKRLIKIRNDQKG